MRFLIDRFARERPARNDQSKSESDDFSFPDCTFHFAQIIIRMCVMVPFFCSNDLRGCAMMVFRHFIWLAALIALCSVSRSAPGCPFCDPNQGKTVVMQFEEAEIVLYGHFANPRLGGGADLGQTDFAIEEKLKDHTFLKGKTTLTLPRYIASQSKFIVLADVYKGKLDAYKGIELSNNSAMLDYIKGAIKLKGRPQPERLRYAFDYLNSPEVEIALNANKDYARADSNDYKDIAAKLPADKIADWLQDPKTSPFRYGLYASLLGHCGNKKHAELIFSNKEDPEKRKGSGLHGLMAAYVMLEH